MFPGSASACTNANGDPHSPGQLAAPAPGREQIRHCISSYVSGAPKELLHASRKKHPTEMQAKSDTVTFVPFELLDPEVARMVNQVADRILGLDGEGEPGSIE
jgi:hypothetical protein